MVLGTDSALEIGNNPVNCHLNHRVKSSLEGTDKSCAHVLKRLIKSRQDPPGRGARRANQEKEGFADSGAVKDCCDFSCARAGG